MSAIVERPLPTPDPITGPYWSAALEGRLVLPRCEDCGKHHFYPRSLCPHCGSVKLRWVECTGLGAVYSYTVVHRAPSPAFAQKVPYVVAVIELAEGPCLMSNLDTERPESTRIGQKVRVKFEHIAEGTALPVFELAE